MEFKINVFHHQAPNQINPELEALFQQGKQIMSVLANLAAQVALNNTVTESAIALIGGLKHDLDKLISESDLVGLQALSDSLGKETQALANAVQMNTPLDPVVQATAAAAATATDINSTGAAAETGAAESTGDAASDPAAETTAAT